MNKRLTYAMSALHRRESWSTRKVHQIRNCSIIAYSPHIRIKI